MLKITGSEDYYSTPDSLLDEITAGIDWQLIEYVLEPSAGRGNICDYLTRERVKTYPGFSFESKYQLYKGDMDCVEIESELRSILKGKGYRVIHDDFLTLHTYKHYDLIIMNPPFSVGARHLLKAIEVQETSGGKIICLLNAETLRNPYSNERKELLQRLEEYGAEISYYEGAFRQAENPTDVEVACVKLTVPEKERKSSIFDTLREKGYEELQEKARTYELAEPDLVAAIVAQYNREIEYGLRIYDELLELRRKSLDEKCQLTLRVISGDYESSNEGFSVNRYVWEVRRKYWNKFFREPRFIGRLTSNLHSKYLSQVGTFANYDFSYWNIKTVQEEIALSLVKGVEDCILDLFDKLSARYSWDEDLKNNIHYYNGWKSNCCWKINRRVVLPLSAFRWDKYSTKPHWEYTLDRAEAELGDIEKALNYLDNGETDGVNMRAFLQAAMKTGQTRNIRLKYFTVTFFKKGTCHITFTNERLLKKLNIFGSQRKGWLPKGYARRKYEEMSAEEQAVIESFEGRESYNASMMEAEYYLFDAGRTMPMLEG